MENYEKVQYAINRKYIERIAALSNKIILEMDKVSVLYEKLAEAEELNLKLMLKLKNKTVKKKKRKVK